MLLENGEICVIKMDRGIGNLDYMIKVNEIEDFDFHQIT